MSAVSFMLGSAGGLGGARLFDAPLTTTLVPDLAMGSATPTFTRATTATVWGYAAGAVIADGPTLLTVASGEARFVGARRISEGVWSAYDANGVFLSTTNGASSLYTDALGPLGYLAEGARTNLALQSQTFGTTWVTTTATITADQTAAPDGTTTADLITYGAGTAAHGVYQASVPVSATSQTHSLYVKPGTATFIALNVQGTAAENFVTKVFDLSGAGALGETDLGTNTGTFTSASITAQANGWYRITLTCAFTDAGTTYLAIWKGDAASGNTFDDHGQVTSVAGGTAYLWGAQTETAAFASTYIPTTTASVTRNADVLTYASAGNVLGTQGTWYAEVTNNWTGTQNANARYFAFSDSANRVIYNINSGDLKLSIYDGTTESLSPAFTASSSVQKIAAKWGGTTMTTYVAGVAGTPAAFDGDMNVGTNMGIGADNAGAQQAFSTIRNVRIYNRALSAAQLQAMTA